MGPCYTCKKTVAFGGIKDSGFRFCSKDCYSQKARFIQELASIPDSSTKAEAGNIKSGACGTCRQKGNVEFHKSVFVWSAILVTSTKENAFIGCTSCARKKQLLDTLGTAVLGWWGFPFGLIMTPLAVSINIFQMIKSGSRKEPSEALMQYARERLARSLRSSQLESGAITPNFAR